MAQHRSDRRRITVWVRQFRERLQVLITNDPEREFLLTLGINREWGATGIVASKGATEPQVYFGKGLGDLDIGYLRPLAVTGFLGFALAYAQPRPDPRLDEFYLLYEERLSYLTSNPPAPDWKGIFTAMTN